MQKTAPGPAPAAIKATIGRRQQQQDTASQCAVKLEDGREALLLVVADGMGGAVGGQVASASAVEAFAAHAAASGAPIAERLRGALEAANAAIAEAVAADPRLTGMGSTLIGAVLDGGRVDWISVGDSLLLAIEGASAKRLNADHSVGGMLDRQAERGEISAAQAAASDQRHLLQSALVGEPIPLIDEGSAQLGSKARLVVASDGVLTLGLDRLAAIVSGAARLDEAADKAVAAVDALKLEDQDNMTIAVAAPATLAAAPAAEVRKPAAEPRRQSPLPMAVFVLVLLAIAGAAAIYLFGLSG